MPQSRKPFSLAAVSMVIAVVVACTSTPETASTPTTTPPTPTAVTPRSTDLQRRRSVLDNTLAGLGLTDQQKQCALTAAEKDTGAADPQQLVRIVGYAFDCGTQPEIAARLTDQSAQTQNLSSETQKCVRDQLTRSPREQLIGALTGDQDAKNRIETTARAGCGIETTTPAP